MGRGALPGRKPGIFTRFASRRYAESIARSSRSSSTSIWREIWLSGRRSVETFTITSKVYQSLEGGANLMRTRREHVVQGVAQQVESEDQRADHDGREDEQVRVRAQRGLARRIEDECAEARR